MYPKAFTNLEYDKGNISNASKKIRSIAYTITKNNLQMNQGYKY